jgi:hypothetical protein
VPMVLQDVIVTFMALGAVGLVVRRVVGVFNPSPAAPACTSCSSCPAPRVVTPRDEAKAIPIAVINRAGRTGDRGSSSL